MFHRDLDGVRRSFRSEVDRGDGLPIHFDRNLLRAPRWIRKRGAVEFEPKPRRSVERGTQARTFAITPAMRRFRRVPACAQRADPGIGGQCEPERKVGWPLRLWVQERRKEARDFASRDLVATCIEMSVLEVVDVKPAVLKGRYSTQCWKEVERGNAAFCEPCADETLGPVAFERLAGTRHHLLPDPIFHLGLARDQHKRDGGWAALSRRVAQGLPRTGCRLRCRRP